MNSSIQHFETISIKKPTDLIIEQIKALISTGVLKPGERLPSERALSEKLNIGRGYIREAIKKMELYGILETRPQSGTFVASLGVKALEGLISNVLNLKKDDFHSLIETRSILEIHAAALAAERLTDAHLEDLINTHQAFEKQINSGEDGIEFDLLFHLKISEFAQNSVMHSIISILTPDIIKTSNLHKACEDGRSQIAIQEHTNILNALIQRDPEKASQAMKAHLNQTLRVLEESM